MLYKLCGATPAHHRFPHEISGTHFASPSQRLPIPKVNPGAATASKPHGRRICAMLKFRVPTLHYVLYCRTYYSPSTPALGTHDDNPFLSTHRVSGEFEFHLWICVLASPNQSMLMQKPPAHPEGGRVYFLQQNVHLLLPYYQGSLEVRKIQSHIQGAKPLQ